MDKSNKSKCHMYLPDSRIKKDESPNMPTVPGPAELLRTLLNITAPDAAPNPRPPTVVNIPNI